MHNLVALGAYLSRYRVRILLGMLAAVISVGFSAIPPTIVGRATDELRAGTIVLDTLLRYGLIILAAAAVDGALKFAMRQLVGGASYQIEYELRNDLFRQYTRLDQSFYGQSHTGDLMARATNDLSSVRQLLGPGMQSVVSSGLTLLVVAVLMLRINVQLGLITLILLPLISTTFVVFGQRMRERYRAVQDQFGVLSTRAQENFSGIRTIKAYAQENAELRAFGATNREYRRLNLRYVLLSGMMWPLMTLLLGLTVALVLLVGGRAVAEGQLTVGEFVSFNFYLALLTWPMISLGWTVTLIQQGSASMGRIAEVLNRVPEIRTMPGARSLDAVSGEIELRDVGVRYGDTWVLRHVGFRVPRGSTTAIVGATGAGKTTLVNLLGRVRDPEEGEVLIDGVDVRQWPLDTLRAGIGYVLAGYVPVLGAAARKCNLRATRCARAGGRGSAAGIAAGQRPAAVPRRHGHVTRRARRHAFGRPETTRRDRTRRIARPGDPGARRCIVQRRHTHRRRDSAPFARRYA